MLRLLDLKVPLPVKRSLTRTIAAASVVTVLAAFALAQTSNKLPDRPIVQPDSADPERGAALYQDNCASCHGAEREGEPDWRSPNPDGSLPAPPHDETGHTWHHGDGLLFTYTKLGGQEALRLRGVTDFNSAMPAFGDTLSDDQIWDILAYIKAKWDPQVLEVQQERTAAEVAAN